MQSTTFGKVATLQLDPSRRSALGQFMTPSPNREFFMAAMFRNWPPDIQLLDPGAGVGSLTSAFIREKDKRARRSQLGVKIGVRSTRLP
jgi:adenine-specific DNA-methyltransferase